MGLIKIPPWLIVLSFYARYIFIIIYPLILSPILITNDGKNSKAAYILLLMSGFWVTGFIPLYVTALFPVVLAPLMGLLPSAIVAKAYMSSSTLLFLGGMILATAAENTNLHRRIAVAFMRCMGHDARLLILGVMLPTWFLSMWMSNTATTVMMITIVEAFLTKLDEATGVSLGGPVLENGMRLQRRDRVRIQRFSAGISLSVCYAASCGGIATLIGSPPNTIFDGLASSRYGDEIPLNFGIWMAYGLPISLLCLVSTWITLCLVFLGPGNIFKCCPKRNHNSSDRFQRGYYDKPFPAKITARMEKLERTAGKGEGGEASSNIASIVRRISEQERQALGPMKFGEVACTLLFVLLIALWITRKPDVPGWSRFMPTGNESSGKTVIYVTDTQPTILFAILAFIIPASNPFRLRSDPTETDENARKRINESIVTWDLVQSRTSWGVLILMGGGFALAQVVFVGELSKVISAALDGVRSFESFGLVCLFTFVGATLTEVVSNSATVTILVPIAFDLAESINVHPFLLSLPLTIATSLAFILPAATPPNAIVYSKGRVTLLQMAKAGIVLNIVTQLIVVACTMTYGRALFQMDKIPSWA